MIALVDQLMKAGWVKRVLFLADWVALVSQATNAFKAHLPAAATVNLVTEKSTDGRVFVSTYPTMMGLDREAAIEAFSDFLADTTFTVDQIRFVNLIVEHLTDNGVMEARRLYESPFTDHAPHGPDMIFPDEVLDGLILTLDKVRAHALPEATVAWPWADAPREVARGGPRGPDCERGGGPHSRKFCKFLGQRYCCAGTLL